MRQESRMGTHGNTWPGTNEKDMFPTEKEYIGKNNWVEKKTNEIYLAACFILGADRKICGKLLEDLHNQHIKGYDDYLKTIDKAYALLCKTI